MLFEILTEDVSDGYIENDILRTLQSMSQVAQNAVIANGEWPDVKTIRSTNGSCFHWTEAESVATSDDLNKLIYAYTSTYAVGSRLDNQIVTALRTMDIWIHILSELGFRESENPFIFYVLKYKNFKVETMRSQLIVLNNLFSSRDIDPEDLLNTNSILFNTNVWLLGMDDSTSLLENYFFIQDNHKEFNPEVSASARLNTMRDRAIAHPGDMENYIVFSDDTISTARAANNLVPAYIVNDFVARFFKDNGREENNKQGKKETQETQSRSNLDRDKKAAVRKFIQDSGLRARDVKDVVTFLSELANSGELR